MKCKFYDDHRSILFRKINSVIDVTEQNETEKFVKIMSCKEKIVTDALGQFIYNSFKERNESQIGRASPVATDQQDRTGVS